MITRRRFELITKCLYMENANLCISDPSSSLYDKLHKVQWMSDEVCDLFKTMSSPSQQMTIKEGMVMYKGKYCLVRQYMPKNLLDLA